MVNSIDYVYLRGGFGNQVFQWANVLERQTKMIILDVSTYQSGLAKDRGFEVPNLEVRILLTIRTKFVSKLVRLVLSSLFPTRIQDNYYFDASNIIRHKTTLIHGFNLLPAERKVKILIHVRGGDYLKEPFSNRYTILDKSL